MFIIIILYSESLYLIWRYRHKFCFSSLNPLPDALVLDVAEQAKGADFSALNIYFDTGINDDFNPADDIVGFGIIAQHNKFVKLLDALGMAYASATYTGAHSDGVYTRIDEAYVAFNSAIQ